MRSKFKWIFTLLVALSMQFSFAQEKTVTGVVSDNSGPLPGANVVVQGSKTGTQTDVDGKYSIKAKAGDVLVFSFVGMTETTAKVGASNSVNVKMQDGVNLQEVLISQGYRNVTKKTAVTAIATVSSETIGNRPNASAINTIQGQLAGVNISANTGQPGAKSTVIIRGVGSINGNTDPLYVIDGFPSNSDNFRSINPNDIETISVLKDAAAVSEYGNRGSNGVILIKTKQAKFGDAKTSFKYDSQYGVGYLQNPKYEYTNSKQLLKLEQTVGTGLGATLTNAQIDAFAINTDWVNYFFRPSTSVSHNLSIENNGKNSSSFTSIGYFKQDGILKTTGLSRFTLRNNINGKSSNEKFKYTLNTAFGYSKNNEATNLGGGAINRNYVTGAFLGAPYVSPDVYTGSQSALDYYNNTPGLLATPIMLIDKLQTYQNLTDEARIDIAGDLSYKIAKDFTLRNRSSMQFIQNRFFQSEGPNCFNALLFSSTPGVSSLAGGNFNGFEDVNSRREFYFTNLTQLAYNKVIGEHTFNAFLNYEYNHSRLNTNNIRQRGLIPVVYVPDTGAGFAGDVSTNDFYVPVISVSQLRNDLVSYFGSVDYDYNKKYGVLASVRRDGSSRFIGDNQWGNFWSVGGRWNLDEESFMDNVTFVNSLKLRGSYGTVGNQRVVNGTIYAGINPPGFADIYSVSNNAYNGGVGYNINFGYPALKWETTTQYNVGVDFELNNSKLRGAFDYYNRATSDLFLNAPVSPTSGVSNINRNSEATVTNKGVELNLAYDLIRDQKNEITLTVRANGAYNDNKVSGIKSNNGVILNGNYITQNGGSINEPFLYHYLGVNPVNGNLLFESAAGTPTETPVTADKKAANINYIPQYTGGFGFDFNYKGFFASTLFTYAFKVERVDFDLANLYSVGNLGQFVVGTNLLNAWTPTNTATDVPSLTATNFGAGDLSDRFLRDASFVRLRNIQIGYQVPKKFLKQTFITDLSFTLQGENLYNFTKWQGFDPESDRTNDVYQYPTPKLYTFGLQVKF
jgi:TonB-linked SusC/RagA family outer membrane protein